MTVEEAFTIVSNAVFVVASLGALRLWWRNRSPSTVWLLATFLVFDAIILISLVTGADSGGPWLVERMTVLLLLGSPYLLFRFADSIVPTRRASRNLADATLVLLVAATLALPDLPEPGEPTSTAVDVYVGFALLVWLALFVAAAWKLVRGSLGQPGVVRIRLRMLAAAAVLLGLVIPAGALIGGTGEDPSTGEQVASSALSTVAGLLFLIGFAPPSFLRSAWRHEDERQLYEAALQFMAAEEPDEVAADLVPRLRALLGAPQVTLYSPSGRMLARDGVGETAPNGEVEVRALGTRRLEIHLAPTMPIFGADEAELLDRLAVLAELALDRTRLLQSEREARDDLQRVNAELESFVYTTSHDLKNPVIALLGYLEVLQEDHAAALPDEARHYMERMAVNARHMEALIGDLLELSRVGRVDVEPEEIDLDKLVDDLGDDLARRYPDARVVRADLPALWMNPTRARQLFSNVIENAAKYGGRDDVRIHVDAAPRSDGGWRVTVTDDGQGIPDTHLDRVFGVFERLDPDSTSGTGMGLAICRRIVETVGGEIRAVPNDGGARIQVDLPGSAVRVQDRRSEEAPL